MSCLSATELSRLHRQRRLECSSPIHRVTPINIKRRSRRNSGSAIVSGSNDEMTAHKDTFGTIAVAANSFDEEVMAANSNTGSLSKEGSGGGRARAASAGLNTPPSGAAHTRSFSFSSFSVPVESTTEPFKSPPPHIPIYAITPPDSPGHRSSASGAYRTRSPRRPSPTPSLGTYLDKIPRGTPKRLGPGGVSRSNSSRSMPHTKTPQKSNTGGLVSESFDSDMPMDELMAAGHGRTPRDSRRPPTRNSRSFETPLLTDGSHNTSAENALVLHPGAPTSSTALVVAGPPGETCMASALKRMTEALQLQTRPALMSADEENLWEVVQKLTKDVNSNSCTAEESTKDATYWEQKYEQREQDWSTQDKEHERALRAIQRVLADVTTEREDTVNRLKEELDLSQQQRDDTILKLTHKLKEMQQEVNAAKGGERKQVSDLKSQLESTEKAQTNLQQDLNKKDEQIQALESTLQKQENEASEELTETLKDWEQVSEKQAQHISQLEEELKVALRSKSVSDLTPDTDKDDLLKELEEKTASLENAKMIIASLENANGSLTRELRAKLKEKEEELATLTSTSADRKRTLDSLATELRELQRQQQTPRLSRKQMANQRALCQILEKNVKALRQAAVQHEARNDQSSVDRISQIVSETFSSLKQNLESWESYLKNEAVEGAAEAPISANPRLGTALAKKNDEVKAMRKELEHVKADSNQETAQLQQEVQSLKQQLVANTEALAKKGRELAVLKDSLNLEDTGVGYISDDGTDGDETEPEPVTSPGHFPFSSTDTNDFSGSLLVHGGPGVASVNPNAAKMSDATAAEIQMLKNEIIKQQKERESKAAELKAEKESLANAKMIISSLEKANKSMLEDLRSRLQDSNTAIASLLEKSIEHEKTISRLRKELETCKQEREKEEQKASGQMAKLRDENLVFSMRLAAKDREVEELQDTLSQYEGQEVSISRVRMSSVEEKKDDPASDEDS